MTLAAGASLNRLTPSISSPQRRSTAAIAWRRKSGVIGRAARPGPAKGCARFGSVRFGSVSRAAEGRGGRRRQPARGSQRVAASEGQDQAGGAVACFECARCLALSSQRAVRLQCSARVVGRGACPCSSRPTPNGWHAEANTWLRGRGTCLPSRFKRCGPSAGDARPEYPLRRDEL